VPDVEKAYQNYVRFEVFTAVTIKNGVFWDVAVCGFCKNDVSNELNASSLGISS
jgi:hypothetical protein